MADCRILRVVGTKAQADQCSTIRHYLGLPAVVGLILPHGYLGLCIPLPAGRAIEVLLADQRVLNFDRPIGIDRPLAVDTAHLFLLTFMG